MASLKPTWSVITVAPRGVRWPYSPDNGPQDYCKDPIGPSHADSWLRRLMYQTTYNSLQIHFTKGLWALNWEFFSSQFDSEYTILRMPWQLSCHGMWKIVTWLIVWILSCKINAYFHNISIRSSWKRLWNGSQLWLGSIFSKYAQCTPHRLLVMVRYGVSLWGVVSSKSDLWVILVIAVLFGILCYTGACYSGAWLDQE